MTTATAPVSWPTEASLRSASKALSAAFNEVEVVTWGFHPALKAYMDEDVLPEPPTLETVGVVWSFLETLRRETAQLSGQAEELERCLAEIDEIRLTGLVRSAEQRGQVYATTKGYGIRWYDEAGARRRQAGFSSPSKARAWFRDVELPRMRGGLVNEPLTLREFSDRYLARYEADRAAVTVRTLKWRLVRPLDEFGEVKLSDLRAGEIAAWEATLPPKFRHAVVRALRQVLDAAVAWEYLAKNPAKATGKNPAPAVVERIALEPSDVDRLAREVRSPYHAAIVVGAWCYLRPSELLALERGDVDGDVLHVRRTLDGEGGTKASGKTRRSLRTVPLPLRARLALAELPPRLDTRLLFPGPLGTPYDRRNFGRREFEWARQAAGLPEGVTPYGLRHSGISWALAAGIPPSDVARFGGTSVTMIERVYAHLLETSADAARRRLDDFAEHRGVTSIGETYSG